MQQRSMDGHTPRGRNGWLHCLLVAAMAHAWLAAACTPEAKDSCVSVGGGWHACSSEMPEPGQQDASDASDATDSGPPVSMPEAGPPPTTQDAGQTTGMGRFAGAGAGGAGAGLAGAGAGAMNPAGRGDAATGGVGGTAGMSQSGGGGGSGDASRGAAAIGGSGGSGGNAMMNAGEAGPGTAGASAAGGMGSAGVAGAADLPATCCHAKGICVSAATLQPDKRALLVRDSCEGDAALCAPVFVLDNQPFVPKTCRSVLQGEGRCLPGCLSSLTHQRDRLPQDVCDTNELCAPCFDPITGNATGLCSMGADTGPRELPQVFRSCCNAEGSTPGLCVPRSYLPAGVVMPAADCAAEMSCVPRGLVSDPTARPAECTAEIRGRGVCLPQCISEAIGVLTVQADCAVGESCFPCEFVGGAPTNVCLPP